VAAQAVTAGVFVANAGTISVIATPVTGWTAVTNADDAAPGSNQETDPPLRLRREQELDASGTGTLEAIKTDLLGLRYEGEAPIASVLMDENTSDYPDALGRPAKTIEAVISLASYVSGLPATDQAAIQALIANRLWLSKPGGIAYYGSISLTVADSMGVVRTVKYSTPTAVPIYVTVIVTVNSAQYAGDSALKDAIKAFGDTLGMGTDVVRNKLLCEIMDQVGVLDISALDIGVTSGLVLESNIAIGPRSISTWDTANITVASVAE
jgi:hypothetical protein